MTLTYASRARARRRRARRRRTTTLATTTTPERPTTTPERPTRPTRQTRETHETTHDRETHRRDTWKNARRPGPGDRTAHRQRRFQHARTHARPGQRIDSADFRTDRDVESRFKETRGTKKNERKTGAKKLKGGSGKDAKLMHQPGIEPGSHRWQRCILPLDH